MPGIVQSLLHVRPLEPLDGTLLEGVCLGGDRLSGGSQVRLGALDGCLHRLSGGSQVRLGCLDGCLRV